MKLRHVVMVSVMLSALAISSNASALNDSTRGPFYVQGTVPLGLNYWNFVSGGVGHAAWRPDVEFGAHFSGRHDGFVLGLRQAFLVTAVPGSAGATTQLRYGYDIPIGLGDFELNIAPFGTFGLGYIFDGPHGGIDMSWGVDGKFFFKKGLYAFARPFEMGFQCAHDSGDCALAMVFGAGVGFAFPNPQ
jgi:hypothetical protein